MTCCIDFHAIARFRETLPEHRHPWFDSLSWQDQTLLAHNAEDMIDLREDREPLGGPGR